MAPCPDSELALRLFFLCSAEPISAFRRWLPCEPLLEGEEVTRSLALVGARIVAADTSDQTSSSSRARCWFSAEIDISASWASRACVGKQPKSGLCRSQRNRARSWWRA